LSFVSDPVGEGFVAGLPRPGGNITGFIQRERRCASFDHLIGEGEQLVGNDDAERLCGADVDDHFKLGRLLDREIGRLGSIEDFRGVGAELASLRYPSR
jgi:hypothetical protein